MRPLIKISGAIALSALLAGCSEYLDRRDTISRDGGDAVATDQITQMVDPWPRASANKNIAFDGAVMDSAVERYRTGRVIPPKGTGTSSTYSQSGAPPAGAANNTTPLGPTVNQAPVK